MNQHIITSSPTESHTGLLTCGPAFRLLIILMMAAGSFDTRAADNTAAKVGAVLLSAGALEDMIDKLSDSERAKLSKMPTKEAWEYVQTPKTKGKIFGALPMIQGALGIPSAAHAPNSAREQERRGILELSQKKISASMPLDAFNLLCKQTSAQLSEALTRELADAKPKGPRYALAVGAFKFIAREGAAADPKMGEALQNVVDYLNENDALRKRFSFIAYKIEDAQDIINRIGGGSDAWLNPEMTNVADVAVKRFHPDDIHLLTGSLVEQLDGDYTIKYQITCRVTHPRAQTTLPPARSTVTYLFHPTLLWLTGEQDAQLRSPQKG